MGPALHILSSCCAFSSHPLGLPLPLSFYLELSGNLLSIALFWFYFFLVCRPSVLLAPDQQLCTGLSIHVKYSGTETPRGIDAEDWLRPESWPQSAKEP